MKHDALIYSIDDKADLNDINSPIYPIEIITVDNNWDAVNEQTEYYRNKFDYKMIYCDLLEHVPDAVGETPWHLL